MIRLELTPWKGDTDLLQEWMLEKLESKKLPLHKNKVSRKALQAMMEIPTNALVGNMTINRWEWLRRYLDKFDEYLAKKRVSEFKVKLHQLWKDGDLPLYRGTVSRARLAELLDLPISKLKGVDGKPNWASASIDEFNIYLRKQGQGTVWELKVPAIRVYLEDLQRTKTLPINQAGKLNRIAVLSQFGLPNKGSPWVLERRAPLLKKLLDEFDKVIADGNYSQFKYDYLENKLQTILNSPDVPTSYGRIVSHTKISQLLNIHKTALRATPRLSKLIEKKQQEINKAQRRGRTDTHFVFGGLTSINLGSTPWSEKHKRVFDFSLLVEPYSLIFAEKVGTVFIHIVSKMASSKVYYSDIKEFLIWLSSHEHFSEIVSSMSAGRLPEKNGFERAVLTYQQTKLSESRENHSNASTPRVLPSFTVIGKFADARIFPKITIPRQGLNRRRRNRDQNSKPSLVEAQAKDFQAILTITEEAAVYRGIVFDDSKDTIAFVNALAFERARRNDLPEGLVEAIAFLCDERLYELRKKATNVFRQWYAIYLRGRILIENATKNGREIQLELESSRSAETGWKQKVVEVFPKKDFQHTLSNLLTLVEHEFHGLCPNSANTEWGQFWRNVYSKVGGAQYIQMHLLPNTAAVSAAVCLYLCESGANSSVGLVLEPSSIRNSKLRGHVNFVSTKARSNGASIFSDLPKNTGDDDIMSAYEALTILKSVTQPLRDKGMVNDNDLLVFASRSNVRKLEEWQFRADVKAIVDKSDLLSEFTITPSMIRPTVLLSAELKNPGNLSVANIIAQHRQESTTMGYVRKLPFKLILEERIRGFMNTLQVVVASRVHEGHIKLGIDEEELHTQVEHSRRTGLGVFCANPYTGIQADYPRGEMCKAVDRCIECSQRIVVAHVESIADMIIWKEALNVAEGRWLEDRYQRWEEVWTPWQAFFYVVLNEKMARGELAVIKRKATELAETRKKSPSFVYPEPW